MHSSCAILNGVTTLGVDGMIQNIKNWLYIL